MSRFCFSSSTNSFISSLNGCFILLLGSFSALRWVLCPRLGVSPRQSQLFSNGAWTDRSTSRQYFAGHRAEPAPHVQRVEHRRPRLLAQSGPLAVLPAERRPAQGQSRPASGHPRQELEGRRYQQQRRRPQLARVRGARQQFRQSGLLSPMTERRT